MLSGPSKNKHSEFFFNSLKKITKLSVIKYYSDDRYAWQYNNKYGIGLYDDPSIIHFKPEQYTLISIRQPIVEFKDIPHQNYILSHVKCNEYCNAFRILGQIQELIADLNKSIKKADEIDLDDFGLY